MGLPTQGGKITTWSGSTKIFQVPTPPPSPRSKKFFLPPQLPSRRGKFFLPPHLPPLRKVLISTPSRKFFSTPSASPLWCRKYFPTPSTSPSSKINPSEIHTSSPSYPPSENFTSLPHHLPTQKIAYFFPLSYPPSENCIFLPYHIPTPKNFFLQGKISATSSRIVL